MTNEGPGVVRGARRTAIKRMLICDNCGAEFLSSRNDANGALGAVKRTRGLRGKAHHGQPRRPLQSLMDRRLVGRP
jgi:hypothetical protein